MPEDLVVAVVVPAYNEARHIARVLSTIPTNVARVFVVDDASTDATAEIVSESRDPRVALIRHRENRGVGAAIATGYARAFMEGADVAVVLAGDGQMDPRDLDALLAPIASGEGDYVKGDRLSWPGARARMPLTRFLGNHALALLTRAATGLAIRDSQCGYTALSREAAARLPLDRLWPGYGYPNDLLASAAASGLRIVEVPVRPVYADETSGVGLRHALFVVPFVVARSALRRVLPARSRPEITAPDAAE